MRSPLKPTRVFCLTSFATLAFSASILGQDNQSSVRTAQQAPTGGSMVIGRAVYDDTGQPATRECIHLIPSEGLFKSLSGLRIPTNCTNENGEFSLKHVAAGEYYVVPRAIDDHTSSGQTFSFLRRSDDPATDAAKLGQFKDQHVKITLDGLHPVEIDLRVTNYHFGSISGKVVDATGQPAARATVHLVSKDQKPFGASGRTDEQGRYKFWGLKPGEYVMSANPPAKAVDEKESPRRLEGVLGATYFPSTLDPGNSPPVAVLADRETSDVNITLIARNLHSISGTVRIRGDNRPVNNAILRLTRKEGEGQSSGVQPTAAIESAVSSYASETDKNGRWLFDNVPDGAYRLFVEPKQGQPTNEVQHFVQKQMDLTVEGIDVEDLSIQVSAGGRISGVVTVEAGNDSPRAIMLTASVYDARANSSAFLDGPGPFTLTAVSSGEVVLSAFPRPEQRFYVKSIEANGLDLLRTNFTLGEGGEIKEVRIVISPNVGLVTGRVLSSTGNKPVADANVLLLRVSSDKLRLFGGKLTGVTDERGAFSLSAAPGAYIVIAWCQSDGPYAFAEARARALKDPAAKVSLSSAEQKQLDLRIPRD